MTMLSIGALSSLARAEPDEGAKLVARELMAKGRTQRDAKDFGGALESFSKAHAIMHVPTTLVEAARARVDAGLWLEALELLREMQELPPRAGEPAPFARARSDAQELGSNLEGRIPSLRIDLSGSPQAKATQLWIDGVSRPDCVSSCRVNPGIHVVLARAPTAQAEEQIRVAERESKSLELVFSPDLPPLPATTATTPNQSVPDATAPVSPLVNVPPLAWAAGGVALAGLGAGAALGISAVSRRDELRRECAPNCAPGDVDEVRRRVVFANLSLGVGVVAAALAVTSYVMGRPASSPAKDAAKAPRRLSLTAAPDVGARGGYVGLGATF